VLIACVIGLSVFAAAARSVADGPPRWRPLPVDTLVDVREVAVSRLDSNRVLAWSGILYRSIDAGDLWELVPARFEGFTTPPDLTNLQFDAALPDVAWATGGNRVVRTGDFGESWTSWGTPAPGEHIGALVPVAGDPSAAWIGVAGGTGRGVHRTTNGGATWERAGASFVVDVLALAPSPTDPDVVLAGTPDGIARSSDGGDQWELVRSGEAATELRWAADGSIVRATQRHVVQSTDGGLNWSPLSHPGFSLSHAFDPADPTRVVVAHASFGLCGSEYCPSYGYAGYVARSTDGGTNWRSRRTFAGCQTGPGFGADRIELSGERVWTWLPHASGTPSILRSDDTGFTWHGLVAGMHEFRTQHVDVSPSGVLFASGPDDVREEQACFHRSTDRGATWSVPDGCYGATNYLELLGFQASRRIDGEALLVHLEGGCDIGPSPRAVRFGNGGDTVISSGKFWSSNNYELEVTAIGFTHGSGATVYIWTADRSGAGNELCKSDDGGDTYTCVAFPEFRPTSAVIAPESDLVLFATAATGDPVRRSTDGGASWESRSRGLPREKPVRLLMSPESGEHLLVVFERGLPWESRDGGASWTVFREPHAPAGSPRDERPAPPDLELRHALVRDADWDLGSEPPRVFLATDRGVWISDSGFADAGLPLRDFHRIAYTAATEVVVAGTEHYGVFGLDVPRLGGGERVAAALSPAKTSLSFAPNPFHRSMRIDLQLARPTVIRLDVYDAAGRRVRELTRGLVAGTREVAWDGRDSSGSSVAAGVYFLRLEGDGEVITRRAVLTR
jgi:hypothetical protein